MTRSKLTTPTNPAVQRMTPKVDFADLHRSMPVTNAGMPTMTPEDARRFLPRPYIRDGACHKHIKSKGW